jgi:hypothetical protein
MNFFRHLCKGCGALYQDIPEHGVTRLVHRGLRGKDDASPLPTAECIRYHDYVLFKHCGHCCPDVFVWCRACKLKLPNSEKGPGRSTEVPCFCHYCAEAVELPRLDRREADALLKEKIQLSEFDVFLCHTQTDKPEVMQIAEDLETRAIRPWLDVKEIKGGERWQAVIAHQITNIKSAAVFIGSTGIEGYQALEVDGFINEFRNKGTRVIPVFLASAQGQPELPWPLDSFQALDFRRTDPDPMAQLEWAITGVRRRP